MVEYENSSGLLGTVPARIGRSEGGESRSNPAGRALRLALTAALLSSTALVAAAGVARAQAVEWKSDGAGDTAWAVDANWEGGAQPVAGADVLIGAGGGGAGAPAITTDLGLTFGGIQIGATAGAYPGNGSLTVGADGVVSAASITLGDAANTGTLLISTATSGVNAGSVTLVGTGANVFTLTDGALVIDSSVGAGTGLLTIERGIFTASGGAATIGGLTTVGGGTGDAALSVTGGRVDANGGLTVSDNGVVTVSATGELAVDGALNVSGANGGQVNLGGADFSVTGDAAIAQRQVVASAGTVGIGGTLALTEAALFLNNGTAASTVAGATTLGTAGAAGTAGELAVTSGSFVAGGGLIVERGAIMLSGTGALTVGKAAAGADPAVPADLVVKNNGALNIADGTTLTVIGGLDVTGKDGIFTVADGKIDVTLGADRAASITDRAVVLGNSGGGTSGEIAVNTATEAGAGKLTIAGEGSVTLATAGSKVTAAEVELAGADSKLIFGAAAAPEYSITGLGGVEVYAAGGTVALKTGNTFTGGVTLTTGTLSVTDLSQIGGATDGKRTVSFNGGAADNALTLGATIIDDSGLNFVRAAADKVIAVDAQVGAGNTFTLAQKLTGKGDVKLSGNGTIAVTGDNDFEGKLVVAGGTVQIDKLANVGKGVAPNPIFLAYQPTVEVDNGGTLAIAGTDIKDDTGLNLTFVAGGTAGLSIVDKDNSFKLRQQIGSTTLVKDGAGTLVLEKHADFAANANTGLTIKKGTVVAEKREYLGQAGAVAVTLEEGFLKVGGKGTGADAVGISDDTNLTFALTATKKGGFDVDTDRTFTLNGALAGAGELVKKGEGTLNLRGGAGAQVNTILEAGILSISAENQLGAVDGDGKRKVTFLGGGLGVGNGTDALALTDANLNLVWGSNANPAANATIDVAASSSVTIASNEFGKYTSYDADGNPLPTKGTVNGNLIKKGAGDLTLENAGIAYNGATIVDGGTLRGVIGAGQDDPSKFRFKDGEYAVNAGGTLEVDTSAALTITELAGSGTTGAEVVPATDPKTYELNAGTIKIANGTVGGVANRETTLTVKETTGEGGFWGKIVGLFTDADPANNELAGKLIVAADAGKEVVLTGNTSQVKAVEVTGGILRVNDGVLPVAGALLGETTTHRGILKAGTVSVNGTEANRASLAGSGAVEATTVTIGANGALRGDRDGTLKITGDVTFADGATIELGRFLGHKAPESGDVTNHYFDVTGTVTAAAAGTKVNLNDDGIDPGVYRVIRSSVALASGDKFEVGAIGDLPAGSITLGLSDEGKNLDLFSTSGRADLRYWNGGDTWTVNGTEWTGRDKTNAGRLHPQADESVVGVFGYAGFPQGGTVTVTDGGDANQYLTQGLQFFAGDWALAGAAIELKGGSAGTAFAGVTTIDTTAGNVAIDNSLTGSAALRKKGGGTLTLTGANTYEGGTVIDGGTLAIAADANLGNAGTAITLNGAGATLALGSGFVGGPTARDIVVNLPSDTSGSVNQSSTIDIGGNFVVAGGLTGNGILNLTNGLAGFGGDNAVSFGGTLNVASNATLLIDGAGAIGTANVAGTLSGSFGHTLAIDNLNLASTAKVWLSLPADSNGAVTAFKGTNAVLGGEISALGLPEGYAVGANGTSLYVFDYLNRSGEIVVSDAVKAQYADSNFTFGGVVNGYLVLNAKSTPGPQPGAGETVNMDQVANLQNWSETTFVDGQTWNNGVATFNGAGTNKPVNVEGNVRIAGLTINGQNYLFKDAGVTGKPGAFLLQAAAGSSTVDFTIAPNGSATIAIPLAGADFAKKGDGHLVLSANSPDFTGTGTVEAGTLYVTGTFAKGSFAVTGGELRVNGFAQHVTVGPNGTLEGLFSGPASSRGVNIGTLVVNGGTLKPGNSPGTLRVGGLAQTAGVIEFERGDKIEVLRNVGGTPNGRAIFSKAANGAQVDLRLTDGARSYTYGHNYTFVTAENGVNFTTTDAVKVTEVGNGRLFSSFRAEAVGTEGRFFLQRDRAFATQAWSVNQLAVAGALESLTPSDLRSSRGPIYDAIASASNDEAHLVRAAFEQLSGEVHASAKGVLIEESRHLREATVNRTRSALSGSTPAPGQVVQAPAGANVALWGQAYGSWGSTGSTTNTAKLDRSTGGFVLGVDTGIADTWRLGIAGGYAKSDIKSNSNLSKADVDNYNLAIYGGGQFGNLGLRLGFGHTWHRLDTERQLNVLGLRDSNHAKYDARTLQLYAEAGYEVKFEAATVEPFLNLAYVNHHSDSFVERGLGLGSALTSHGQNESTGFSTLGLRMSKNFDLSGAKGTASGTLGWKHAFGDVDPSGLFSAGPALFAITGAPIAKNAFVLGVGLDVEIAHGTTLGVSYNGQVGNHTSDHGVKGNFSVKF